MIRNDKVYRYSKEQLSELEAELHKLSSLRRSTGRDEVASAVIDALRMQIEDLERETPSTRTSRRDVCSPSAPTTWTLWENSSPRHA